jgi:hypothetical protein
MQPEEVVEWLEEQNSALLQSDDSRFIDDKSSAAKRKALDKVRACF